MIVAVTLVILSSFGGPAAAGAQSPAATDPSPGSPPGTIYRLPVDTGRSDAAPRGNGGDGLPTSTFRSENNFGTSSVVPGAPGDGGKGVGAGDASGLALGSAAGARGETGETSELMAFSLLGLVVAVGALLGLMASRPGRHASR